MNMYSRAILAASIACLSFSSRDSLRPPQQDSGHIAIGSAYCSAQDQDSENRSAQKLRFYSEVFEVELSAGAKEKIDDAWRAYVKSQLRLKVVTACFFGDGAAAREKNIAQDRARGITIVKLGWKGAP